MVCLVYSTADVASVNIANAIKGSIRFSEAKRTTDYALFTSEQADMMEIHSSPINADFVGSLVQTDCFIFLSKHASAKGIPSFTVHTEGNWSDSAEFGGKPKMLGMSSPKRMLAALRAIDGQNETALPVLYEATHHGPLLDTPSFFVELGGDSKTIEDAELAGVVGGAVAGMLLGRCAAGDCRKVAVGIGGQHYNEKFARLSLECGYAFAHILPGYNAQNIDMLDQAVGRSDSKVELAVIEWKGIKAGIRDMVIKRLDEMSIGYERV